MLTENHLTLRRWLNFPNPMMVIRFMPGSRGKKHSKWRSSGLESLYSAEVTTPCSVIQQQQQQQKLGFLLQTAAVFSSLLINTAWMCFRNNDSPCGQEGINTSSAMLHLLHRLQSSTLPSPSFPIFPPALPPLSPSVFVAALLWISHSEKLGLISITRDLFPIS